MTNFTVSSGLLHKSDWVNFCKLKYFFVTDRSIVLRKWIFCKKWCRKTTQLALYLKSLFKKDALWVETYIKNRYSTFLRTFSPWIASTIREIIPTWYMWPLNIRQVEKVSSSLTGGFSLRWVGFHDSHCSIELILIKLGTAMLPRYRSFIGLFIAPSFQGGFPKTCYVPIPTIVLFCLCN